MGQPRRGSSPKKAGKPGEKGPPSVCVSWDLFICLIIALDNLEDKNTLFEKKKHECREYGIVGGESTWYIFLGTGCGTKVTIWNLEQLKPLPDFVEDISKIINVNFYNHFSIFQT